MPLRRIAVFAAFAATLAFVGTPGARAATPLPVAPETFAAGDTVVDLNDFILESVDCTTGQFTFMADGPAVGDYPGTFIENGSGTIVGGVLTSFHADFTINSTAGIVTGSKDLAAPGTGACVNTGSSLQVSFDGPLTYTAEIGSFQDSGTAEVHGQATFGGFFAPVLGADPDTTAFSETFLTSNGVVPLSTGGHVTGGGWLLDLGTLDRVSFGFEAKGAPLLKPHVTCTVIDHTTKDNVRCLSGTSIVVVGTHATIKGSASVNGGPAQDFTIDVDDLGEPGVLDTFKIQVGTFVRGNVLSGGNIQIHTS